MVLYPLALVNPTEMATTSAGSPRRGPEERGSVLKSPSHMGQGTSYMREAPNEGSQGWDAEGEENAAGLQIRGQDTACYHSILQKEGIISLEPVAQVL